MLDIRIIRDHADEVKGALARRHAGYETRIDLVLKLDQQFRDLQTEAETLNRRKNEISKDVQTGKITREQAQEESKHIKQRSPEVDQQLREVEQQRDERDG